MDSNVRIDHISTVSQTEPMVDFVAVDEATSDTGAHHPGILQTRRRWRSKHSRPPSQHPTTPTSPFQQRQSIRPYRNWTRFVLQSVPSQRQKKRSCCCRQRNKTALQSEPASRISKTRALCPQVSRSHTSRTHKVSPKILMRLCFVPPRGQGWIQPF